MAITESFKYIVPYIHQCTNTTLLIPRLGTLPNPSATVNDPDVKLPVEPIKIFGSAQCGLTSIGMLCNYWLNLKIGATNLFNNTNLIDLYEDYDKNYKQGKSQLSNFEKSVGFPTIVRNIFKSKSIETGTGNTFHPSDLYEYKHEFDKSENYVLDILDNYGPVILHGRYDHLGADKVVREIGHYSVLIGYDLKTKSYIVNDPFYTYDFTKNLYTDPVGEQAYYPSAKFLKNLIRGSDKRGIRIMYVKEKNP